MPPPLAAVIVPEIPKSPPSEVTAVSVAEARSPARFRIPIQCWQAAKIPAWVAAVALRSGSRGPTTTR